MTVKAKLVQVGDGAVIPTGFIGETKLGQNNAVAIGGTDSVSNVTDGVTLTTGKWLLTFSCSGYVSANPASNAEVVADVYIRDGSSNTIASQGSVAYIYNNGGTISPNSQRNFSATISVFVNVTSSTTYYGSVGKRTQSGSDTSGQWTTVASSSSGIRALCLV